MQKFYQSQSSEVTERIPQWKKPKLLDIGCGCGTETLWFAKLGAECMGIDLDNSRIEVALERKTIMENLLGKKIESHFQLTSVFDLDPRERKFDMIWMEQAFHHIEPREKLLPLLFTLLNDNGLLIISESNAWNPLIQLSLLKSRGLKTISYTEVRGQQIPYGVERIIPPLALWKSLWSHGFTPRSLRYFRIFPSNKIFDKVAFLEPIWPRALFPAFTHYNIVAEKLSLADNMANRNTDST